MQKHEQDFYGWTKEQASLLRQGRFAELDTPNLIEELEDMGKSQERELESHLGLLLAHLLKWQYQPQLRSQSWRLTIKEQRWRIERLLSKNPSLRHYLPEAFGYAYGDAILQAARETGLEEDSFPTDCPFSIEQVLDPQFLAG